MSCKFKTLRHFRLFLAIYGMNIVVLPLIRTLKGLPTTCWPSNLMSTSYRPSIGQTYLTRHRPFLLSSVSMCTLLGPSTANDKPPEKFNNMQWMTCNGGCNKHDSTIWDAMSTMTWLFLFIHSLSNAQSPINQSPHSKERGSLVMNSTQYWVSVYYA